MAVGGSGFYYAIGPFLQAPTENNIKVMTCQVRNNDSTGHDLPSNDEVTTAMWVQVNIAGISDKLSVVGRVDLP